MERLDEVPISSASGSRGSEMDLSVLLQPLRHLPDPILQLLAAELFAQPIHNDGEGEGRELAGVFEHLTLGLYAEQRFAQPWQFHLHIECLVVSLPQEEMLRFVITEHIEEEAAVGAHMTFLQRSPGHAFEDEPCNAGDVAELALGHLGGLPH